MKVTATIIFKDQRLNDEIPVNERQADFEDEQQENGEIYPALAQVAAFGQIIQSEGLLMTVKGAPVWYPASEIKKMSLEQSRIQTL